MILTCPSCSTRYLADPASLQPSGRMVRCANCGHSWFQKPPEDMPRSVAGGGSGEALGTLEVGGTSGARRGMPVAISTLALWLLLIGAVAGSGYLAYQYRVDIVRGWPQAATLYDLFGVEVNSAGMEFRDIAYDFENQEGLSVLAVRGSVVNVTDQALPLPRVRVSLRDDAGEELYYWTVVLDETRLDAGAATQFVTRLSSPPLGAARIEVTFADGAE
jgi:predicted Zn finger-like uncharacterized protein